MKKYIVLFVLLTIIFSVFYILKCIDSADKGSDPKESPVDTEEAVNESDNPAVNIENLISMASEKLGIDRITEYSLLYKDNSFSIISIDDTKVVNEKIFLYLDYVKNNVHRLPISGAHVELIEVSDFSVTFHRYGYVDAENRYVFPTKVELIDKQSVTDRFEPKISILWVSGNSMIRSGTEYQEVTLQSMVTGMNNLQFVFYQQAVTTSAPPLMDVLYDQDQGLFSIDVHNCSKESKIYSNKIDGSFILSDAILQVIEDDRLHISIGVNTEEDLAYSYDSYTTGNYIIVEIRFKPVLGIVLEGSTPCSYWNGMMSLGNI